MYCASAIAGVTVFLMWRRLPASSRRLIWPLYGWFSGLMACASCFGSIAWGTWLQSSTYSLKGKFSLSDIASPTFPGFISFALYNRWYAAFHVTYAVEFFCQSLALLTILDRLVNLATIQGSEKSLRCWLQGKRAVVALVLASNVVGLCGNGVAAAAYARTADLWEIVDRISIIDFKAFYSAIQAAINSRASADRHATVQLVCEVVTLLLILASFVVTGAACVHRVNEWLSSNSNTAAAGIRKMHLQIVITCSIVFVTFLIRAVHAIMFALAHLLQDTDSLSSCPSLNPDSLCDASCVNTYTIILEWMRFTPEFRLSIILISSPLAMLVALWGMTSRHAWQLMTWRFKDVQLNETPLSAQRLNSAG